MNNNRISPAIVDRLAKHLVALHPYPGAAHSALESVIARGQLHHFSKDNILCKEGDTGEEMWFLVRGSIQVQRIDPNGQLRVLATISRPSLIGHMALIDRSRRSATCVAHSDSDVVVLSARTVEMLLQETTTSGTALRRLLLSSLCGQLAGANAQISDFVKSTQPEQADEESTDGYESIPQAKDTDDQVASIVAKLGGWDSKQLEELEALEDEIVFVVDEDQKRQNQQNPFGKQ